jgi:hypothetical protein
MTAAEIVWAVAAICGLIAVYFVADAAIDWLARRNVRRQLARDAEECCCDESLNVPEEAR